MFHPGAIDASQATPIRLGAGEERGGVDITAVLLPMASVSGRLVDVQGQSVSRAIVQMHRVDAAQSQSAWPVQPLTTQADADGRFLVPRIAPGTYRAVVRGMGDGGRVTGSEPSIGPTVMDEAITVLSQFSGGSSSAFWAQQEIVVDGRDLEGIELRLQRTLTLSGRVVTEGTPLPAHELTRARVMVAPIPDRARWSDLTGMMAGVTMANIKEDGTFEVQSLVPGAYRVQLMSAGLTRTRSGAAELSPASGWMLKSVDPRGPRRGRRAVRRAARGKTSEAS